jgi:tripartite-type tricarboxylate transporter receptor subunit TctC
MPFSRAPRWTCATRSRRSFSYALSEMRKHRVRGIVEQSQPLPGPDRQNLPEVPTIAETLPGFEAVAWYAIMAPPGTPNNIAEKINADVNEALRQPEIQDRLRKLSAEPFGGSTEKTRKYMQDEVRRWGSVIKAADVRLQE